MPLVVVELAHARARARAGDRRASIARHALEQLDPGLHPRHLEHVVQRCPSVLSSVSRKSRSTSDVANSRTVSMYARRVGLDQPRDAVVRQRLAEPEQRQRRRHPLQIPRVVAEVGLVEVVDVEHQHARRVHVRAVVLGVQVALDPHARGRVVDPRVLEPVDVRVEQRRAAAVEGERVRGHLAELPPERARVALDQVLERVDEDGDDVLLALVVRAGEIGDGGHARHRLKRLARPASAAPR